MKPRLQRWVAVLLMMLCGSWALSVAHAGIVQVGVFEDAKGSLSIADMDEQVFEPSQTTLARGYTQSTFWLRLVLDASDRDQLLRVRPPYLDQVTLFRADPHDESKWIAIESGDYVPISERRVWGVSLLFYLPASDSQQTVYVRLKTESSSLITFDVMTLAEVQQSEFHTMLLQLLTIAVTLGLLIWAALDYSVNRQPIVGLFVLLQLAQIGFVLAIGGYLPILVGTAWVADRFTSVIVVLTVMATALFHRTLAAEFEPSQWALRLLNVIVMSAVLALVLVATGPKQVGLVMNTWAAAMLIPALLWLAATASRNRPPGLLLFRGAYVVLAGWLIFIAGPVLGVPLPFDTYLWAITTQGLINGLIMAALLFRRSLALQRDQLEDQMRLVRIQEKLQAEQRRATDQREFLDMLAHELKTPLGVIQLTLDAVDLPQTQQQRLHRSLEAMSAVIDRCRLSLQLDELRLTASIEPVEIEPLTDDLLATCKQPDRINLDLSAPSIIKTDRQLLLVILQNLLDNAIKYSVPGSKIALSIASTPHLDRPGVCFEVGNKLTSRPVRDAEMLFEKYFRGTNAQGQTGSGLGLHLSRRLAIILGGALWAQVTDEEIRLVLWLPDSLTISHLAGAP